MIQISTTYHNQPTVHQNSPAGIVDWESHGLTPRSRRHLCRIVHVRLTCSRKWRQYQTAVRLVVADEKKRDHLGVADDGHYASWPLPVVIWYTSWSASDELRSKSIYTCVCVSIQDPIFRKNMNAPACWQSTAHSTWRGVLHRPNFCTKGDQRGTNAPLPARHARAAALSV